MDEEKVSYGLSNVHYATYTEANGVITFDTPVRIPGAVEMTNDPVGDPIKFYADNMIYYQADNNQGYEGKFSIAHVPDSFKRDVLGEELDEVNGVMSEYADAKTKPFALLFQFENDVKARRHVMFNCNAQRPSLSSSSKSDKTDPNTTELNYTAGPILLNGRPIVKTSTTQTTPQAVYDAWFNTVFTGSAADTTPPTVIVTPADAATAVAVDSNIVWTFSEAIREADVTSANFIVTDATGAEVAGTLSLNTDKTVVTFNPTDNLTVATAYTAIATKNIRDLAGNSMAANSVTNFTTA